MILQTNENEIVNTLDGSSVEFSIENSAKMFDILSNKIYAHPIRAIIRELSCNAIDAHLDMNLEEPIHVYLPTEDDCTLKIQDFGIGMTHEDVITVYKSYGKSTKSSSNKLIGALGLGGKTPLAYTQQFTLTTARDGTRNNYIIFRNEEGIPEVTHLGSEPSEETGTTVEIIVKQNDIKDFHKAAFITFVFFDILPEIKRGKKYFYNALYTRCDEVEKTYKHLNSYIKANERFCLTGTHNDNYIWMLKSIVQEYSTNYGVIMNNVFYTVDKEKLHEYEKYRGYSEEAFQYPCDDKYSFYKIIKVDSGAVAFQPSREALSYSTATRKYLHEIFIQDFDNWINPILDYNDEPEFLANISNCDIKRIKEICSRYRDGKLKSDDLIQLVENYNNMVKYFFDNSKLLLLFSMHTNHNNKYQYNEVNLLNQSDIFYKIFSGEYKYMLEFDNPEYYCKLLEKHSERKAKNPQVNLSSFFGKFIEDYREDMLILDKFSEFFKDNVPLELLSITDLEKEYIAANKTVTEKGERSYGKRNTEGKCYDGSVSSLITIQDLRNLLKTEEVTYEFFEGEYGYNGWYYEVDFNDIKSKNSSIRDVNKRGWRGREKFHPHGINFPKHHLYVDFTFFKRNELWNMNNLYFYKDYYLKTLVDEFTNIKTEIATPHIHNNYYFKDVHPTLRNYVADTYGNNLDKTMFINHYNNFEKERNTPDTDFDGYLKKIDNLISHQYFQRQNYLMPAYNQLATKLKTVATQLKEDIKKIRGENISKDYSEEFIKKYPMMEYLVGQSFIKSMETVVDYIALVENIKPL